jgi:hypothetical protein
MQKRDLPCLALGTLIGVMAVGMIAACRATPNIPDPNGPTLEPTADAPAETAEAQPEPSPPAADLRPLPASDAPPDDTQPLGSDRAGLALSIPRDWANLTGEIDTPAMGNRLGINLVFAANTERTGRSLLAGKTFDEGAYVSGLLVSPGATTDPAAALVELLTTAAPTAVRLTDVVPLATANDVPGVMVDVADGPIGLNAAAPNDLRTRVVLYTPPAAGDAPPSWVVLLLSASAGRWEQFAPVFDEMLHSVRVADVRPGVVAQEGQVVVRGQLEGDHDEVSAALEPGVSDVWTFAAEANRYVTLSLRPDEPHLDLTLTVLGPDRQAVARADNGYAGATESVTDLLLAQPGVYIVEVSDFYRQPGRYGLSLALSGQPQFSGGGPITLGQALQGQLPAGSQHYWVFQGTAGQRVSIVVEPGATTFDAVLDLYGPDGQRLAALDEGYSGDPEVLAGFALPATGEYAVLVRSFSPQGGPYTLSLDEADQPVANFYDAGDLAYGDVRPETLQPQEAHAWFFQGRGGDHILVRVTPLGPGLDPDVWLLGANLERVAAADAFPAGEPETIELTLSADGQYIVLVRDFGGQPGEYEIALGAAPIATPHNAGALSYGDSIIGGIAPDTAVAWSFNAQAGDVISVEATPGEAGSDIVLQLQGPDGLTALSSDTGSAGAAEAIRNFVIPVPGSWRVVLREFFGQAASYRLALQRAE